MVCVRNICIYTLRKGDDDDDDDDDNEPQMGCRPVAVVIMLACLLHGAESFLRS